MGLRLSVRRSAWDAHVASVAALPGIVPVVKGNGYGFGRPVLMPIAARLIAPSANIAVGTVYEAHDVPADRSPWVLTPHLARLPADLPAHSVLTVGSIAHVAALCDRATAEQGWGGR